MGHRYARIGRNRHGRRNARHCFKGNVRLYKHLQFLSPSAEDKGVSAFQAKYVFPFFRLPHKNLIDLFLGHRMLSRMFAHIDCLCIPWNAAQQFRADQGVIDDYICPLNQLCGLHCQKSGVPRTCAGKPYFSGSAAVTFFSLLF